MNTEAKLAPGTLIHYRNGVLRIGACRGGYYFAKFVGCEKFASERLPVAETHEKIASGEITLGNANAYKRHEVSGRAWLRMQKTYDEAHANADAVPLISEVA